MKDRWKFPEDQYWSKWSNLGASWRLIINQYAFYSNFFECKSLGLISRKYKCLLKLYTNATQIKAIVRLQLEFLLVNKSKTKMVARWRTIPLRQLNQIFLSRHTSKYLNTCSHLELMQLYCRVKSIKRNEGWNRSRYISLLI